MILNVDNLSHSFGERELYRRASFRLNKGDHMGVVGQNGTGKSTLIRILLGELVPSDGYITWQSGLTIGHLDQYADVDSGLTIVQYMHTAYSELYALEEELQSLYAAMSRDSSEKLMNRAARCQQKLEESDFYTIDNLVMRVAAGLGLPAIGMDRPLETLSGGQRTKVILAKLLLSSPDVLLLDEPTNFLDSEHIEWLSGYLKDFPGSFMIVSHDFDFLERITNCICDIEFETIKTYHGKYSDFVRQKTQRRADYARQYAAQKRETDRLEAYIAKNKARASTAKMARGRQKMLDRMDRMPPPSVLPKPDVRFHTLPRLLMRVLTVEGLLVGYTGPLLPKLHFTVEDGQKVVVTGFNGIGKSTLLKTLVGSLRPLGGSFRFADGVRLGYFEQDMKWPDPLLSPIRLLLGGRPELSEKQIRRELAHCGVTARHAMRPLGTLSGGEQNKVKLCRLTMDAYNFLILDEPTNHLDAETKEALREALKEYPGTVILVCHETSFYKDWADRVIDIEALLDAMTKSG